MKIFACIAFFSIIFLYSASTINAATTVTVGAGQVVITPAQIFPWTNPFDGSKSAFIDSPISTFKSGGVQYWINSRGFDHAKYRGTVASPFQTVLWNRMTENYFIDPYNLIGGPFRKIDNLNWTFGGGEPWMVNLYQISDSELLAFVHIEQGAIVNGTYTTGRSSIGLAYSNNAAESFKYLGDILQIPTSDTRSAYNVQGAPYFIKDGYFYVYYHDLCPGAATIPARAPVTEVIQAAKTGKVSPWKKYYNGGFTSSGLGGPCSRINIATGIDHTDAAYSTHTGKYYILLSRGAYGPGISTWIKLYESADGINWTFLTNIVEEPYPSEGQGYQYVTIVNSDGSDNSRVGNSFYVYSAKNVRNASVHRWLVTLTAASSTTAPTPTPTITPRPPTPPPTATPTRSPSPTSTVLPTPTTSGNLNPGDLNGDGAANVIDLGIVIDNYNKSPIPNPKADINRDGTVNILDIGVIVDNYTK